MTYLRAVEERRAQLRAIELHRMPYASYLRTPEWRAKRLEALGRAGWCCQRCDSGQELHVHHLTYRHRGYEAPHELIVLCASCHRHAHWRVA